MPGILWLHLYGSKSSDTLSTSETWIIWVLVLMCVIMLASLLGLILTDIWRSRR